MILEALLLAQAAVQPASLARGEKIFAQSCSVGYCHGVAGAAGRGPRLRGRSFLRDYLDRVVREGVPNSAMPGWKERLKEEELRAVADYVASLASAAEAAPPPYPMPPGEGPAALKRFNGPPQAERGLAAFFDAARENCGSCHAMGGRGIAIGPDLSKIAGSGAPAVTAAVQSSRSRHVLNATLADGDTFPALQAEQGGSRLRLYDLTVVPPVLRSFKRSEVSSLRPNPDWPHREVAKGYTALELADIAAYLRWAATGK